jgi:hypothetical protein
MGKVAEPDKPVKIFEEKREAIPSCAFPDP